MSQPVRILFFADASSVHTRRWVAAVAERGGQAIVITREPADVPGAQEVIAVMPGDAAVSAYFGTRPLRHLLRHVGGSVWFEGAHGVDRLGLRHPDHPA